MRQSFLGDGMPQLISLGRQILRIVFVDRRHDGHLVNDAQVESAQIEGFGLLRVIRQQSNFV